MVLDWPSVLTALCVAALATLGIFRGWASTLKPITVNLNAHALSPCVLILSPCVLILFAVLLSSCRAGAYCYS